MRGREVKAKTMDDEDFEGILIEKSGRTFYGEITSICKLQYRVFVGIKIFKNVAIETPTVLEYDFLHFFYKYSSARSCRVWTRWLNCSSV